jgi:hypothetical protein
MKSYIPYTLLAAAAACGMALGQTAYTTPVGYSTQSLALGFNAAGLTLQNPAVAAGNFETITATTLTDSNITYAPVAGRMYILEFTSGSSNVKGSIFEIPAASISGSTITVTTVPATDLVALGVTSSDKYSLRLAPTLEDIFTTVPLSSGGVLNAGLSATGADVVWVPTGPGTYAKYFLHSSTLAFRLAGTTTPTPNVPLIYADGILIEKKSAAAASLVVSGEVKKVGTTSAISLGFNLLGQVSPVGLNLGNAGLEAALTAGLSATGADNVWIQQPNLSYIKYFRRSSNGAWRTSTTAVDLTPSQVEAVTLSNGFFVEKKSAGTVNLKLNVPASYDNL